MLNTEIFLKKLGFSEKEVGVYVSLLELGSAPASNVAKKAQINRGTTYDVLDELIAKGLVTAYVEGSKKIFSAEPPRKLTSIVLEKAEEIRSMQADLAGLVSSLEEKYQHQGERPEVRFFQGRGGVRSVLEDILASMQRSKTKVYYVYSAANLRRDVYESMKSFTSMRIKSGIRVKTIALGEGGKLVGLDERKWMSIPESELKTVYQFIYAGKVAHVSLDKAFNPIGVVVEDRAIYETQKLIFEFNWSKL